MRRISYIINLLIVTAILIGCGESLEDTYDAGNGRIRYLGKCKDLSVTVGWKRLHLEWKNSVDADIESVKVSWTVKDVKRDSLLPRGTTSCELLDLADGTYFLEVCAVDKNGNESFVITNYARPYTEDHEIVRTFTKAITKFYKVGEHLVFFMDTWNDNIIDITLHYTSSLNGGKKQMTLTKEIFKKGFDILKNVDTREKIYIEREGKLEGCPDTLKFEPIELEDTRIYTSDFKSAIQMRYGFSDKSDVEKIEFEHFIDTVTMLEFDYDMTTFEDVLYCSKLKKIILGKNRYLVGIYPTTKDKSILYDEERSIKALNAAIDLRGVVIERYNDHYFGNESELNSLENRGATELPDNLSYILPSMIDTITCSIEDQESYLEELLDNDMVTWWESTLQSDVVRTYELTIVLKEEQPIHGIKIIQALYDPTKDRDSKYYIPSSIKIKTSVDERSWQNVTFMEENTLGQGSGESTLLPIAEGTRSVKFIKVTLVDGVNGSVARVKLADIVAY